MFITTGFLSSGFVNKAGGFRDEFPNSTPPMMGPLADVTPRDQATHFSTGSGGDWNNTATWDTGTVPGAGDKVVILSGDTVTLKGNNTARVEWLLVEGTFNCDTAADSFLRVGSLTVASGATMQFGSLASPLSDSVTAEIQFANLGNIDVSQDTWALGRGLNVGMNGTIKLYGAAKDHWAVMVADAGATDTSVVLDRNLVDAGWKVGDVVAIGNDTYDGWQYTTTTEFVRHQSEERTITSFSTTNTTNDTINFTGGLSYSHAGNPTVLANGTLPDLRPYVFNLSRNIKFSAENPDTIEIHQRPHAMFHTSSIHDCRYFEAKDFGRTNRGIPAQEAYEFLDQGTMSATANVNGRYGWHFHFVGTNDAAMKSPPIIVGGVIRGSAEGGAMPGWGYAQHQSCGEWYECIAYLVKGSGFAAEDGNERGIWKDCGAMSCEGWNTAPTKIWADDVSKKAGHNGSGFFSAGRELRIMGCVSHDCQWGFDAFHRSINSDAAIPFSDLEIPEISFSDRGKAVAADELLRDKPPIRHWGSNTAIGCRNGIEIHKAVHNWPSEQQSIIRDFTYWNRTEGPKVDMDGMILAYTGGYIILDPLFIRGDGSNNRGAGVKISTNTIRANIVNPTFVECTRDVYYVAQQNQNGALLDSGRVLNRVINSTSIGNLFIEIDNAENQSSDDFSVLSAPFEANTFSVGSKFTASETASGASFSGEVTDYYGTYTWQGGNQPTIAFNTDQIGYIVDEYGYWQNGASDVAYIPMLFSDRLDGAEYASVFEITLDGSRDLTGKTDNGAVASPATAPSVSDIATTATANTPTSALSTKTIDLSAAVNSGDGTARYYLVGSTDWAQVVNNRDGTISYIPDIGFTGDDVFPFFVWDGQQGITKAQITVTVS